MSVSNGTVPLFSHSLILACNPFSSCTFREFPVFRPNKYFFDNHLQKDEEKWECYARATREIISGQLQLRLSDQSFKHKVEYKTAVFGSKKRAKDDGI
jgi:hypothetical protein